MILDDILETKKEEVAGLKASTTIPRLQRVISGVDVCRDFKKALRSAGPAIIAEVKRASPSRGRLVESFDPLRLAKTYEQNGAAAISVLTDKNYFQGDKDDLTQIKRNVSLPVLRKDFIIDPFQIYETRAIGADAVLLIARVLGTRLADYIALSKELGLHPLVEVHTSDELDAALAAKAEIIGINNRDLDTFATDIHTSLALRKRIPDGPVVVAESAIRNREDIEVLMRGGIHAFLIGEGLVTAPDVGAKLRSFLGRDA
jgi:indole-3-glycerol phosphate synthase